MVVTNKIPLPPESKEKGDKQWENPENPENSSDERDIEQLARQKKEAELRKSNLTEDDDQTTNHN